MYMTWIVFIRDGHENKIPGKPDHFINFRKRYSAPKEKSKTFEITQILQ